MTNPEVKNNVTKNKVTTLIHQRIIVALSRIAVPLLFLMTTGLITGSPLLHSFVGCRG